MTKNPILDDSCQSWCSSSDRCDMCGVPIVLGNIMCEKCEETGLSSFYAQHKAEKINKPQDYCRFCRVEILSGDVLCEKCGELWNDSFISIFMNEREEEE
jgi:hypothetical protein